MDWGCRGKTRRKYDIVNMPHPASLLLQQSSLTKIFKILPELDSVSTKTF